VPFFFLLIFLTVVIIENSTLGSRQKVFLLLVHKTIFRLENVQNIPWGNVLPATVFTLFYLCIFWTNVL